MKHNKSTALFASVVEQDVALTTHELKLSVSKLTFAVKASVSALPLTGLTQGDTQVNTLTSKPIPNLQSPATFREVFGLWREGQSTQRKQGIHVNSTQKGCR